MQFNSAKQNDISASQWNRIAQHEIGHVFGLADLYESYNNNRLMYGYYGGYSGLTTSEKEGLDVIW